MANEFGGFPNGFFKFYKELSKNNERDWFNENKERYLNDVVDPALEFIAAIEPKLRKVSPHFLAIPKRSRGSLMRIYRDTRFSKKPNLGINFRHEMGKDVHAPGFYFHFDPKEVFLGAGVWCPDREPLNRIRMTIDDHATRWKRVTRSKKFKEQFALGGSSLKRPPRGYEAEHALIEDLKRKDHVALSNIPVACMKTSEIVDVTIERIKLSMPYVRFLCDALHLPS